MFPSLTILCMGPFRFRKARDRWTGKRKGRGDWPRPVLIKSYAPARAHAGRDEPCVTRLTTVAAMPASTALACGDFSMSMIGFDPGACP